MPLVSDTAIVLCDRVDSRMLQAVLKDLADPLGHWRKPNAATVA